MKKSKKLNLRHLSQLLFFIFIAITSFNHQLVEKGAGFDFISKASIHGLCPFGGVETMYKLFTEGSLIQKVHQSSLVIMAIVIVMSILFGPIFCGWICPLGTFQEWLGKLGKKIFKNKYNNFIPYKYDKYMRYFRYIFLTWVLYVTYTSGKLLFNNIDPYHALFNFWAGEVAVQAIVILIIIVLVSIFIERPWCKYLCPFGAILGLTNLFRIFKIRRDKDKCVNCKNCSKGCPMNIDVANKTVIKDHQCISCLKCTSEFNCPIKNTVEFSIKEGK